MQDLAEIHQRLTSARGAMTVAIGRKWTIRGHLRTGTNDPKPVMLTDQRSISKIVIG
jgi:hypothetical protein